MTILDFLLSSQLQPFTVAWGLLIGLLLLEVVSSLLGLSSQSEGAEGPEAGEAGFGDVEAPEFALEAEELDIATLRSSLADQSAAALSLDQAAGEQRRLPGIKGWLGFGQAPFILLLGGYAFAFGLAGYVIQIALLWAALPLLGAGSAVLAALVPGLIIGRSIAGLLGRLLPKTETSAISRRSFGARQGVIAVGTARSGSPAQARFTDGYGNLHHVMVEPYEAGTEIGQGERVFIFRGRDRRMTALSVED
ncbi:MAG: OB-fold-containig protein [Pseudomonadota bacterium]